MKFPKQHIASGVKTTYFLLNVCIVGRKHHIIFSTLSVGYKVGANRQQPRYFSVFFCIQFILNVIFGQFGFYEKNIVIWQYFTGPSIFKA